MATNQERREATRAKLITVAREHFARNRYEGTHTGDILEQAGLSRGALYHHFKSKQELFEAVFISTSIQSIDAAVAHGALGESPVDDLISASLAWLKAVRKPNVAKILLDLGPQVLGWKHSRQLESKTSLGLMIRSIKRAVEAGEIEVASIELTARLLNSLLAEAALANLYREPATSIAKQEASVRQFINGLRLEK